MAYSATIDGQLAWGPRSVGQPVLMDPFESAANIADLFDGQRVEPYQDYHAWQFTPASFRLVMLEVRALGLSDWEVTTLHGPENFEFFAVLRHSGARKLDPAALQIQRQRLLLAQLAEAREQTDFILGTPETALDPGTDRCAELIAKLADQDERLREMSETLAWVRAILSPGRRVWRRIRGKNREEI
jgi:hypothetical protein